MVYVSLGARVLVNVEALNMVESIGNVTRHRRATIVHKRGDEYVIRVVPAVSGESLAHAYQSWVTDLANREGLPLCDHCARCEFLKHCDSKLFGRKDWEQALALPLQEFDTYQKSKENSKKTPSLDDFVDYLVSKHPSYARVIKEKVPRIYSIVKVRNRYRLAYDPHLFEKEIVANCVVEDIGGFLFPGATPVKRTSRFLVGYMIPAFDAIEKCAIEPQFHVRHSPSQALGTQAQAQMIYYVEIGSAPYVFSFGIDLNGIGKTSMLKVEDAVGKEEKVRRVEVALRALGLMLDNRLFGAKLPRFNPVTRYEVVLAAVSKDLPFMVSTPATKEFVFDTLKRMEKFTKVTGSEAKAFIYAPEDIGEEYLKEAENKAERVANVLDLTEKALEVALNWLG